MSLPQALIVDDEPDIRELLELTLAKMNIGCRPAADLQSAIQLLRDHRFDLCLADMRLPDGSGLELVEHIGKHHPQLPVAVITAHGNMETAIDALKAGAFDFVSKPVDLPVLRNLVDTALRLSAGTAPDPAQPPDGDCPLRGESHAMKAIRAMINKLARSQAPVYISGESGTGKELAARLIHDRSPRASHPFIAVNCGAIPQELMESELFGHVKGSFTGASANKEGLFLAADGGTLFLDEIADLPLLLQVKLLRVIQEKMVRPVGSATEIRTDVRIISATHKNLGEMVQQGQFRQDLYYRLNVIELRMPPLSDRREDIPGLVRHILHRISGEYGQPPPRLSDEAAAALANYPFPGNVRELENILERAFALCERQEIQVDDLGLMLHQIPGTPPHASSDDQPAAGESLEDYLARRETCLIRQALRDSGGNQTLAAKKLGINPRALRYRLKKLSIDLP